MADRLIGGLPTEDYYLIVVDAFEGRDTQVKGNKTPGVEHVHRGAAAERVKFSDVAAKMNREGRALLRREPCPAKPVHRREARSRSTTSRSSRKTSLPKK